VVARDHGLEYQAAARAAGGVKRQANAHRHPEALALQRLLDDSHGSKASRSIKLRLAQTQTALSDQRNKPVWLKPDGLLGENSMSGAQSADRERGGSRRQRPARAGQSRDPRTADMGHSLLDQGVCGQLNFRMDRRCVVALRTRSCRGASSASPFSTPTAQCGRCPVAAAGRATSTVVSESERAPRVAVDGAPARTLGSMFFAS